WSVCAVHFALLPFSISADWPPLFFSVLAFCTSFTSLNPAMNLYFDPALRNAARSYFGGREKQRRIGSLATRASTNSGSSAGYLATRASTNSSGASQAMSRVSHFDEGGEEARRAADAGSRASLKNILFGRHAEAADEDEERALELGKEFAEEIEQDMEPIEQDNQLVKLRGGKRGLKVTATVRASAEDVAAFLHDFESVYYNEAADKDKMVRDRYTIEDSGRRSHVTYSRLCMPRGRGRDRVVCSKNTTSAKSPTGVIMYVSFPTTHADAPEKDGHVRASCISVYRIKPMIMSGIGRKQVLRTTVELYTALDFKMGDADIASDKLSRSLTVRAASEVQRAFLELLALEDLQAEDGTALGAMLMSDVLKKSKRPLEAKMDTFVDRTAALREAQVTYSWLKVLLVEVLKNKLHRPSNTLTPLAEFGQEEGKKVGGALALLQLKKASPSTALEAWIAGNPALGELKQK
ncbi:hypothetical protein TeGR_g12321, partial [Tetraparma gracilis]